MGPKIWSFPVVRLTSVWYPLILFPRGAAPLLLAFINSSSLQVSQEAKACCLYIPTRSRQYQTLCGARIQSFRYFSCNWQHYTLRSTNGWSGDVLFLMIMDTFVRLICFFTSQSQPLWPFCFAINNQARVIIIITITITIFEETKT